MVDAVSSSIQSVIVNPFKNRGEDSEPATKSVKQGSEETQGAKKETTEEVSAIGRDPDERSSSGSTRRGSLLDLKV